MSWDKVKDLYDNSGWNVESHGHNNNRYDTISSSEIWNDILTSAEILINRGYDPKTHVYVGGGVDGQAKRIVNELYSFGLSGAGNVFKKGVDIEGGLMDLPRYSVDSKSMDDIKSTIDEAINNGTGIIINSHEIINDSIANEGSLQTSTEKIKEIADYVSNNAIEWTDTTTDLLRQSYLPLDLVAMGAGIRYNGSTYRTIVPQGDNWYVLDENDNDRLFRWQPGTEFEINPNAKWYEYVTDWRETELRGNNWTVWSDSGSSVHSQFQGSGATRMDKGGPAPLPTDLTAVSGNENGEVRVHDGSGTPPAGIYWWDANGLANGSTEWVRTGDHSTTI